MKSFFDTYSRIGTLSYDWDRKIYIVTFDNGEGYPPIKVGASERAVPKYDGSVLMAAPNEGFLVV